MGRKKKNDTILNAIGDAIHVVGDMLVKEVHPSDWLPTGEQWCPECHVKMERKEDEFVCPECGTDITVEEAEEGWGYPTLESTYEDDYGEYYEEDDDDWF